jgi:transporter family-2 protein
MKGFELSTLFLLGLAVGAGLTIQAGVNAQFRQHLYSPFQAAFFSFLVGTIILAIMVVMQHANKPSWQDLMNVPAWLWVGGFLGAFNISMSIILAPRLGALSFIIVIVCGQLITSTLLDHFGWLGFNKHPINWQRVSGIALVFIGLLLSQR